MTQHTTFKHVKSLQGAIFFKKAIMFVDGGLLQ